MSTVSNKVYELEQMMLHHDKTLAAALALEKAMASGNDLRVRVQVSRNCTQVGEFIIAPELLEEFKAFMELHAEESERQIERINKDLEMVTRIIETSGGKDGNS